MITVVVNSCGRLDLLKRTLDSFNKYKDMDVDNYIIIDDSGDEEVYSKLREQYPEYNLILPGHIGLIKCIDRAYSSVITKYIFRLEDDWEFIKSGFMRKSMDILEADSKIMQVWLRGIKDPNGHPVEKEDLNIGGVQCRHIGLNFQGIWHGFSFNPGMLRLSDYNRVAPYNNIRYDDYDGDNIAVRECHIGWKMKELGFRSVALMDEYCIHIGGGLSAHV